MLHETIWKLHDTQTNKTEGIDIQWVKVEASGTKYLFIGVFYRPSVRDTDDLRDMMDSAQRLNSQTAWHIWLTGDFNLAGITWRPDAVNTKNNINQRYERTGPFSKQRDRHLRCKVTPGISGLQYCTDREKTKTMRESSINAAHPYMETLKLERINTHMGAGWSNLLEEGKYVETAEHLWLWLIYILEK